MIVRAVVALPAMHVSFPLDSYVYVGKLLGAVARVLSILRIVGVFATVPGTWKMVASSALVIIDERNLYGA